MGKISFTTDIWTDTNLSAVIAVTAHWIEAITKDMPNGPQQILTLRVDLIRFHHVPTRHDGRHLAHAFLFVIDRLNIASKVAHNHCPT